LWVLPFNLLLNSGYWRVILLRFGRNDGEKATAPPPAPPRPADPVDAPEALPLTEQWTTLDDYQLNRLLRESSS